MKATTQTGVGINRCSLYFCYEDYNGDFGFTSYADAQEQLGEDVYLTGFLHNYYYNCTERVDSIRLTERPTVQLVKQFIRQCKQCLNDN